MWVPTWSMTPTKIGVHKYSLLKMKATIYDIRESKNGNQDFMVLYFMPSRDVDGVVHIIEPKPILTAFVESLQLVKGDIVQL